MGCAVCAAPPRIKLNISYIEFLVLPVSFGQRKPSAGRGNDSLYTRCTDDVEQREAALKRLTRQKMLVRIDEETK